ncbi:MULTISPECIES: hypothetical protein [Deinococcus]|nr:MULTISPECIES: hypothetical protein [Deinococcus]
MKTPRHLLSALALCGLLFSGAVHAGGVGAPLFPPGSQLAMRPP